MSVCHGLHPRIDLYTCHHMWPCCPECKFNLVWWYFCHWFLWRHYCMFSVLLAEWAFIPVGLCDEPWETFDLPQQLLSSLLKDFKAPFNLEGPSFFWMSISGHWSNGSVMWSHLKEVVWIKPRWCLFKHLCSYRYCTIWNSAEPNRITWISCDQLSCTHHSKSQGCVTPLSTRYVFKASNFLQDSIGSHVTSPNVHLTCNSKLLVHLWAIISLTNHSCLSLLPKS